ncbi:Ig-like domain-containing protein [Candidatus Solirubrobacter pratensis]|uniref:Ig-like domain-containing protein n=1 Tax=Candidatus Solirubrobacter pratensis TaxID=1298857 RepID=UPI00041A14D2|nr:Ig-like domain-containing protein [Candidatus Solirubrobacter pratensis]
MRILMATVAAVLALASPAFAADGTDVTGGPSGTTTDATPTFTFRGEPGASFECKVAPVSDWKPCASPYSIQLADGDYVFSVRATDEAGNVETDPPSRGFTVDTAFIDTTLESGPDGLTSDTTPSFTFSSTTTGSTFECRIDGPSSSVPTYTGCSSPFTAPTLRSGDYVLRVRAKSPEGRLDSTPSERAFKVDADAPDTQIADGPAAGGETPDTEPTFAFSASEPSTTYECRFDNTTKENVDLKAWTDCAQSWKAPKLAGGQHTLEVRATDPAGNTDRSPATRSFTVRDCERVVRFGVIEATGDCLANIGTQDAAIYESNAPIRLNGLPIPTIGGSKTILRAPTPDKKGGELEVQNAKIVISGVTVYTGGLKWELPEGGAGDEKELKKVDLSGAGQKLFGMKVEGYAALRLRRPPTEGGAYRSVFALHIALPEVFKSGPDSGAGGVTGDVAINVDNDGVHVDGIKIQVNNAYIGKLGVKSVCLSFAAAGSSAVAPCQAPSIGPGKPQPYLECRSDNLEDRWDGAIAIVLPTASKTELGMWGGLRAGRLSHAGAYVDRLGTAVPLAPGIFLESVRLGVCLEPPPFQVKGGAAIALGPSVNGVAAVRIDADMHYSDAWNGTPWFIRADGRLSLFDKQVASSYFTYWGSGLIEFGMEGGIEFGDSARILGKLDGWVETRSPSRFNVQGDLEVCVDWLACLEGHAVASTIGAAACVSVKVVSIPMLVKDKDWHVWAPWRMHWEMRPVKVSGGAGYTWANRDLDLMVGSCSIGKWVLARSAQAPGGVQVVAIPADQPAATFRVHGDGAPPKFDLVGPHGRRIAVPDRAGGEIVKGSHMIAERPSENTTTVFVASPAAGEWRVEPRAGSARITEVEHALAQPEPAIGAGVTGTGYKRTLGYAFAPQPGQKVTFVERGPKTAHVLGVAKDGRCKQAVKGERKVACGKLKFAPARGGAGRREIVAMVQQDGRPRAEVTVATYVAPKDRSLGAPRLLRARRAGGRLLVRWQAVAGASGYNAVVTTSDGRRLTFSPRRTGLRVPAGRDTTVRVAVRGLRADNSVGRAARVRVKATRRPNLAPHKSKPIKIKKGGRR